MCCLPQFAAFSLPSALLVDWRAAQAALKDEAERVKAALAQTNATSNSLSACHEGEGGTAEARQGMKASTSGRETVDQAPRMQLEVQVVAVLLYLLFQQC